MIKMIHKIKECPCILLNENSDPEDLIRDQSFERIETNFYENSSSINYYIVRCNNCKKLYKVIAHEYHYIRWEWILINE